MMLSISFSRPCNYPFLFGPGTAGSSATGGCSSQSSGWSKTPPERRQKKQFLLMPPFPWKYLVNIWLTYGLICLMIWLLFMKPFTSKNSDRLNQQEWGQERQPVHNIYIYIHTYVYSYIHHNRYIYIYHNYYIYIYIIIIIYIYMHIIIMICIYICIIIILWYIMIYIICFIYFPRYINLSTFGGHGHTLVLQEFVLHIDHLVPELLQL